MLFSHFLPDTPHWVNFFQKLSISCFFRKRKFDLQPKNPTAQNQAAVFLLTKTLLNLKVGHSIKKIKT